MAKATSVIDVILGEAAGEKQKATVEDRYEDMLGIASVIDNRSTRTKTSAEDVVAAKDKYNNPQFDAYGNKLPSGVEAYRDLAEKAWNQVQTVGPVHNAVFYAAPGANLGIKGLETVAQTKGHIFYDDPQNRNILVGDNRYAKPSEERFAVPQQTMLADVPGLNVPTVPANAYAPDLTNPAQFAFGNILSPTPVQTTSIATPEVALPSLAPTPTPSPAPATSGLGLAALAPNGLRSDPTAPTDLDSRNARAIASLHPDYQDRAQAFLDEAKTLGLDLEIASSYRSPAEQQALYSQGRTTPGDRVTNARPGSSFHNFGTAMDVVPADLKDTHHWSPNDSRWSQIGQLAEKHGLTWGGNFKSITDMPHIQAPGVTLSEARNAPVDSRGYPQFSPSTALGIRGDFVPTPTERDVAIAQMEATAQGARDYGQLAAGLGAAGVPNLSGIADYNSIAPVGDVERASIPSVPDSVFAAPVGAVERSALPSVVDVAQNEADIQALEQQMGMVPTVPDYAQTVAPAGFDFSIPTTPTQVASLAPAPVDSVERSSLPSLAPAPAVPSTTDMANAYGQLASTMTQAGVTGLGAMPSTPSAPSATTFASLPNTLTAPANTFQGTTPAPVATSVPTVPSMPAAPAVTAPSINTAPAVPTPSATPAAPKSESPSLGSRLGHAAIGGAIGGLPGAVIGGLFGPAITSTTKDVLGGVGKSLGLNNNATPSTSSKSTGTGLGGFLGGLGDVFSGQSNITMPESTYSVGKGVDAIGGVFSGAFGPGATAISLGNPNVSFTDLGNGNVAKVNSELGTTSIVNASSFNWNGPMSAPASSKTASSWGLGDVFGGLGDAASDAFSGWGGDAASASSYSGPNSTTDPSDSW